MNENITDVLTKFIQDNIVEIIVPLIVGIIFYLNKKFRGILINLFTSFWDLFKSKKSKINSIKIEGATNINKKFIKEVKTNGKKEKYKAVDFYLAKQYELCQWYGILNNWDIERDVYSKIKIEIKNSFADKFRQTKITSLIHGRGGTGKSTLMRRIAVDHIAEDFCVIWINDKEISKFHELGINQLSNYSDTKFLVLIEDWYRIKQNTEKPNEIINSICNYPNVRVIIGDRIIDSSVSKEHIFNPDENIIELSVKENSKTISNILKKVPHWKTTAESILTDNKDYKSSLYLILWVIARTYQAKNQIAGINTIKNESLIGHFQTIVESDLKAIAKHYPGLAKILYYYGSIYSEHKTYLGFNTFIDLADSFNEKGTSCKLAFASKEISAILYIYINKSKGLFKTAGNLPLITFNHDILADEGLSKAQINEWCKFDDSVKFQLLPIIVDKGDEFSASNFLTYIFHYRNKENLSDKEILNYIIILFNKKNRGSYLSLLFYDSFKIEKTIKIKFASSILKDFINYEYQSNTICYCLNQIKHSTFADKTATDILSNKDLFKITPDIVNTALKIAKNNTVIQKIATNILSNKDVFKFHPDIVVTTLKISKNENEIQKTATDILSNKDLFKLNQAIVITALKISNNDAVIQNAATDILSNKDLFKLHPEIVVTALKISKNNVVIQNAATYILSRKDLFKLNQAIVCTALKISENENVLQKAANDILSHKGLFKLPPEIVATAIIISRDISIASFFLSKWENTDWRIVYQSLLCFSETKNPPIYVVDIVHSIINFKGKSGKHYFRYIRLLKIPFHGIPRWNKECNKIIKNYENGNPLFLKQILIAHYAYPNNIKNICKTLLNQWKTEIIKPIKQLYGDPHFGDNIKIALGHPDLRIIAKKTAQEIQDSENKKSGSIPKYLLEIANSIIIDNEFPEWY